MSNIVPSPSKTLSSPPVDQSKSLSNANQPSSMRPLEELSPKADKQSASSPMVSTQGASPCILSDSSSPGPKVIPPSPSVDILSVKSERSSPSGENSAAMSETENNALELPSLSKGRAETPKNEPTASGMLVKGGIKNAIGEELDTIAAVKNHSEKVTDDGPSHTSPKRQSTPASAHEVVQFNSPPKETEIQSFIMSPNSISSSSSSSSSISSSNSSNSSNANANSDTNANKKTNSDECTDSVNSHNENGPSQMSPQSGRQDNRFFTVGVSEDRNKRCRRTMEDAHSYFYDFAGIEGQGFYAIFDGHAGKQTAEWCGHHFHETFQQMLEMHNDIPVQEVFDRTFAEADRQLSEHAGKHSGCTAVTAFIRTESLPTEGDEANGGVDVRNGSAGAPKKKYKRVLYTANVGDARAVLCRDGAALRLSYDHKGSDPQEAKRIMDAGGFVMNNRVNGVLAVTRSLGDSSMKDFVVGAPYTAETVVTEKDPFVILACDGLWDVCTDQVAVDLIKDIMDPQRASEKLLEHALANFTTDNLSVMVVRFHND